MCFNTATFSCAAGEQMTLAMDMIAQTSQARASAISYVEPTNENLVLHHHTPGSLSWNGQTFELIDFEYKIETASSIILRFLGRLPHADSHAKLLLKPKCELLYAPHSLEQT